MKDRQGSITKLRSSVGFLIALSDIEPPKSANGCSCTYRSNVCFKNDKKSVHFSQQAHFSSIVPNKMWPRLEKGDLKANCPKI